MNDAPPRPQARSSRKDNPLRDWQSQVRRERFKNFLLASIGIAAVGAVAYFAYTYYQEQNAPRQEPRESAVRVFTAEETAAANPPLLKLGEGAAQRMDELLTLSPREPEPGKPAPLDSTWVQQAGYRLASAEKAIGEGRYGMALNHYRKALEIYPELKDVQRYIGTILLEERQHEQALEAFNKALAEPGVTPEMRCGILNNMGGAHRKLGRPAEAEKCFREALRENPDYLNAHFNLAGLLQEQGRLEEAVELYKAYRAKDPRNVRAAQHYAGLLVRLKQWQPAAEELSRILEVQPDDAPLHFYHAQALAQSNQPDKAMEALQRASRLVDSGRALGWISQPEFDPIRASDRFQQLVSELSRKAARAP